MNKAKSNTNSNMHRLLLTLILLLAVSLALVTASVAWLMNAIHINEADTNLSASSVGSYFAGGTGASDDPYILTKGIHLYNLAWLQYLGIFNTDSDSDGTIEQIYFRVDDNIEMENLVIPPIGTEENPFIGNFNGNGHYISGITVSNYLSETDEDNGIVEHPASVEVFDDKIGDTTAAIVGFFGVIGDFDGSLKGKIANDSATTEISSKVNAVYDLFLKNITVRTETKQSLIGLLAGYVNGSISNVGVGTSNIYTGQNVDALNIGGLEMLSLVSEFSLIGEYNEDNVAWEDAPGTDSDEDNTIPDGEGSWGGSIDMLEINKRITYMSAFQMNVKSNYYYSHDDNYNLYVSLGYGNILAYKPATNTTNYLQLGTIIPLNIDAESMFKGDEITHTSTNGISNLLTTNQYKNNTGEIVSDTNTGFIVGSVTPTHSATGGVRIGVQRFARLARAYGGNTSTGISTDVLYSAYANKLVLLGYDGLTQKYVQIADSYNTGETIINTGSNESPIYTSNNTNFGTTYAIVNGDSAYINYNKVRDSIDKMFIDGTIYDSNSNPSKTQIHAMRFYEAHGTSLGSNKTISVPSGTKLDKAEVSDLLVGSLDFRVRGEGLVTTVATTAFGSGSLFRLYTVDRNSDDEITAIHQVSKIYRDKSTNGIVYEFADGTTELTGDVSNYTLLFDYPSESSNLPSYALYYFEIPVRAGEYALGRGSASSTAYLMYLDVGANGDIGSSETPDDTPDTEPRHVIDGINFVDDSTGISNDSVSTYPLVTVSLKVENATHAAANINYSRYDSASMSVSGTGEGSSLITPTSNSADGVTVDIRVNPTYPIAALPLSKEEEYY